MFDTRPATDPVAVAMSWTASRGIDIRRWPQDGRPIASEHPVLYLLAPGAEPPRCGLLEDWLRLPIELDELHARADRLLARAATTGAALIRVDDGALHVGDSIVILSEQEERLVRVLIERQGQLVPRGELQRAVWPDGAPADPRALDNRVKTLRARLRGLPLRIHTIRGQGLLLERT